MTTKEAKRIIASALAANGLENKLTARTIGFDDLARGSRLFVNIHGWRPSPLAEALARTARENGFSVEFS